MSLRKCHDWVLVPMTCANHLESLGHRHRVCRQALPVFASGDLAYDLRPNVECEAYGCGTDFLTSGSVRIACYESNVDQDSEERCVTATKITVFVAVCDAARRWDLAESAGCGVIRTTFILNAIQLQVIFCSAGDRAQFRDFINWTCTTR